MSAATQEKTRIRYVYHLDELDRVPEGALSATVAPCAARGRDTRAQGVGPPLDRRQAGTRALCRRALDAQA